MQKQVNRIVAGPTLPVRSGEKCGFFPADLRRK